ncbi:helicase-associated domain-containing protein [Heliobacterium chlorum]|uniref:Helicase-associated domain-containing protein n=1 Tax=Heliobacterium chlorum TaxID=2698 RepID=A0ABR7T5I9_HELCL|nr:helicase-associated domain-containing protein [Heliobacterium chlorum]MBC9785347.1 helicase-associated domain-containing protein [Heliobacterium chlorum]
MITALDNFYCREENLTALWGRLNAFEKELLAEYVRSGRLDSDDLTELCQKHGRSRKDQYYFQSYRITDVLDAKSPARLFLIRNSVPVPLAAFIKKQLKPLKHQYQAVNALGEDDADEVVVIRENFEKEFFRLIKLANQTKLSCTRVGGLPTKSAMKKINEALAIKEYSFDDPDGVSSFRTIEQSVRIYGMARLALESGIWNIIGDRFVPGHRSGEFLQASRVDRCKMLLKEYIASADIDELSRIPEVKVQTERDPKYSSCRRLICDHLAHCPVDQWVHIDEFLKYIKRSDALFLERVTGEIESYADYERMYLGRSQNWRQLEGRFVEIVCLEYLCTMGIIDTAIRFSSGGTYGEVDTIEVDYIRLTPLGAYVLGAADSYEEPKLEEDSGFIVQPNFEILLSEGAMKETHELFLDQVAEKLSDHPACLYKLSFKSAASALDQGIPIREVIEYLQDWSSKEVPQNVLHTLEEWSQSSQKIRIRKAIILETDDPYVLEELKSYKSLRNHMIKELPYVIELDPKSPIKVKREIEKKNRFCIYDAES